MDMSIRELLEIIMKIIVSLICGFFFTLTFWTMLNIIGITYYSVEDVFNDLRDWFKK